MLVPVVSQTDLLFQIADFRRLKVVPGTTISASYLVSLRNYFQESNGVITEAGRAKSQGGGSLDLTVKAACRPLTAARAGKPHLQRESPLRYSGNKQQDKYLTAKAMFASSKSR